MVYRVIGLMSGSSLDGLDIVFAEINENGGKWQYSIEEAACYPYSPKWTERLRTATSLSALDYQLLHIEYGAYLGEQVNRFISEKGLHYKVGLVASHGHTTFHLPASKMTAQLGDGAAIAAATRLPVVTDLRAMDIALGGQGAPIVPVGEKMLLGEYELFLNIGGIANISGNGPVYRAFDICPANRVLNMLAARNEKEYDEGGYMAATGKVSEALLQQLDRLEYYSRPAPKSLANDFGTHTVYPLIEASGLDVYDALSSYCEHIAGQVSRAIDLFSPAAGARLLITGGGAFNSYLVERIRQRLLPAGIEVVIPEEKLVNFKEALIMALIGVLRWREEANVLSSVTGASRDSVGGALWMGQEG